MKYGSRGNPLGWLIGLVIAVCLTVSCERTSITSALNTGRICGDWTVHPGCREVLNAWEPAAASFTISLSGSPSQWAERGPIEGVLSLNGKEHPFVASSDIGDNIHLVFDCEHPVFEGDSSYGDMLVLMAFGYSDLADDYLYVGFGADRYEAYSGSFCIPFVRAVPD
jgi:hypothetical protein